MAKVAIFTSGNGSNFQTIAETLIKQGKHEIALMVCNKKEAFSYQRAINLKIESYHLNYLGRSREEAETEIVAVLKEKGVNLIVLAGYMKLLTPVLIDAFPCAIVNIHPALLPKYPGTHGIQESYQSGDLECGVSIHYVDYGMDTGPIIKQVSFIRDKDQSLESFESKIHELEHANYPIVVMQLLDDIG